MARKPKKEHHNPNQARGDHSTQNKSTTRQNRVEGIIKTEIIDELVTPVFTFPFTATYDSELEISDSEDMLGTAAEASTQTTMQNRIQSNDINRTKNSSFTIERSSDQRFHVQRRNHRAQNQMSFAAWENQAFVEEPFNGIGEVCFNSADTAGRQQDGNSHGQLGCKKKKKRGGS